MKAKINFDDHHPYFKTIAEYHWSNGEPVIYRNENGKLIEHWFDGTYNEIEEEEEEVPIMDKRYEKPFEDDGAYAD